MLKISGNKIYLTRGDTMILQLNILDPDGEEYTPTETDRIFFRVKRAASTSKVLIEKEIDVSTMLLQLDEEDTMDFKFASYVYEIELVTESNYHFTVIENEVFEIGKELEIHNNE
jgi:hypothetical protein